jgi:predicted HAD superfamily Cof-like phosphohydrolase
MTLQNNDFTVEGDFVKDIADMHTKFGVNKVVQGLSSEQLHEYVLFRLSMVQEEVTETLDAFNIGDASEVVDGLIDAIVFAIGTLDALNVDAYEAWARVRDANMSKEPGIKPGRPNKFGFPDLIKPEGWQAPTHEDNIGLLSKVFENKES